MRTLRFKEAQEARKSLIEQAVSYAMNPDDDSEPKSPKSPVMKTPFEIAEPASPMTTSPARLHEIPEKSPSSPLRSPKSIVTRTEAERVRIELSSSGGS